VITVRVMEHYGSRIEDHETALVVSWAEIEESLEVKGIVKRFKATFVHQTTALAEHGHVFKDTDGDSYYYLIYNKSYNQVRGKLREGVLTFMSRCEALNEIERTRDKRSSVAKLVDRVNLHTDCNVF